jgi:Cys-tRNA(Pro)/Cys-tRNA(Cys) deacylase
VGATRAKIASPAQVEKATGFVAGAVAPFPLPQVERVFVDRNLLSHKHVWVGAGSPNHMAELSSADLVRLARAQVMDAVEAAT